MLDKSEAIHYPIRKIFRRGARVVILRSKIISRGEAPRDLSFHSIMKPIWYLYIIECRTKDLYVGISKDVEERVKLHNRGKAVRYTKYRWPVKLLYKEPCGIYNTARAREQQFK